MLLGQIIEKHLEEIKEIAQLLWDKGWAEASSGNYSVCLDQINFEDNYLFNKASRIKINTSSPFLQDKCLLISAAGSRMRDVAKHPEINTGLLHISKEGDHASFYRHNQNSKTIFPTSEIDVHLALHNQAQEDESGLTAVLHAHVTEIIAFTHLKEMRDEQKINDTLNAIHPEYNLFIPKGVGLVPFMESANTKIAQESVRKAKEHRLIIWEKHGLLSQAENLNNAFDLMDIVAKQADIYMKCLATGNKSE